MFCELQSVAVISTDEPRVAQIDIELSNLKKKIWVAFVRENAAIIDKAPRLILAIP